MRTSELRFNEKRDAGEEEEYLSFRTKFVYVNVPERRLKAILAKKKAEAATTLNAFCRA